MAGDPQRLPADTPAATPSEDGDPYSVRRGERGEALRSAFTEFLGGAFATVFAVLVAGLLTFWADEAKPGVLEPVRAFLARRFFVSSEVSSTVLQSLAGTVITVASITFSLLLVAIQQSASSLTTQVFDQFLRRRTNQFSFGFFIGVGVYALLQSTTVQPRFNPVFGATLAVLLSVVAVLLLLVLTYAAVNQMRPNVIIEAIHDHLLEARVNQLHTLVDRTLRTPRREGLPRTVVTSAKTGFVMDIDIDAIQRAIERSRTPAEVVLDVTIGKFVAYNDVLAHVHADEPEVAEQISNAVEDAIRRQRGRTIDHVDPGYGVQQLENLGWTSTSSAQQNPHAARLVVAQLRDVLARATLEPADGEREPDTDIVYEDDFPQILMDTVESLAVATADSQQHQVAAEIIVGLTTLLPRLPEGYRERADELLMRTLPALASHPPTQQLERALEQLRTTLERTGSDDGARLVRDALEAIRSRIGRVDAEYTPR